MKEEKCEYRSRQQEDGEVRGGGLGCCSGEAMSFAPSLGHAGHAPACSCTRYACTPLHTRAHPCTLASHGLTPE